MGFLTKALSPWKLVIITMLVLIFIVAPLTLFTAWKFVKLKQAGKYRQDMNIQTEEQNRATEGLGYVQKALEGMVFYEQNPKLYTFEADTLDFDNPSVSFVSRVPPDFPGSKDFGGQAMRRIQIAVEDDEAGRPGRRELVMYQTSILQPPDGLALAEPVRHVLIQNLEIFMILFWSNIHSEWLPEWEETNAIPSRILIEMAIKQSNGEAAQLSDILKHEITIRAKPITMAMQSPRIPIPGRGGSSRGSSGRGSGKSSPTTPQPVAGLKKVPERGKQQEAKRSGDTRSRYTSEQIARYREAMAERSAGARGIPRGNTLPPGMVSGELGLLLYTGKEPPPLTPETQPSPPTRGNNRPTGLVSGELGLLLHTGPRPSSPPQQKNTVPTRRGTPPR